MHRSSVYTSCCRKASGPDDTPNWLLREYADPLAYPVSKIISASFVEQHLPHTWKLANVSPLPKKKPVSDLKKDLRPISLSSCLSKVAEDCIVVDYMKPAVLKVLDQISMVLFLSHQQLKF